MKLNILKIKSRKRLWDIFEWAYKGKNYLSKNHSLNCGCSWCKMKTYERRRKNKQNRLTARLNLKNHVED
jgi:hypothetical protein